MKQGNIKRRTKAREYLAEFNRNGYHLAHPDPTQIWPTADLVRINNLKSEAPIQPRAPAGSKPVKTDLLEMVGGGGLCVILAL